MQNNIPMNGLFSHAVRLLALVGALLTGVTVSSAQTGLSGSGEVPASAVSSTYRLSAYDVIDVSVYNEEDLHTRTRLGSDGTALLPLIGTV